MKKTRYVAGAFIFFFLFLLIVVFYAKPKTPPTTQPPAFVTPAPIRPSVMPQPISSSPIVYTGEPQLSFPKSVTYYGVVRHRDFEIERARLFALYNIITPPNTIIGSKGRYASFSVGSKSGTISENPLTFAFHTVLASKKFVTNNVNKYLTAVTEGLTGLSVLPDVFTPTLSTQRYFTFDDPHPTELAGPENALITTLDFVVAAGGLPVFINDADTPAFSASLNGDDALTELRGFILPDVSKSDQRLAIIPYDEAVKRLKNNTGIFSSVSLTVSGDKEFMTGELPTAIRIESVVLGYFYSARQDYLVPVFVFTGVAAEPNEKAVLRTTTVVSAL